MQCLKHVKSAKEKIKAVFALSPGLRSGHLKNFLMNYQIDKNPIFLLSSITIGVFYVYFCLSLFLDNGLRWF